MKPAMQKLTSLLANLKPVASPQPNHFERATFLKPNAKVCEKQSVRKTRTLCRKSLVKEVKILNEMRLKTLLKSQTDSLKNQTKTKGQEFLEIMITKSTETIPQELEEGNWMLVETSSKKFSSVFNIP